MHTKIEWNLIKWVMENRKVLRVIILIFKTAKNNKKVEFWRMLGFATKTFLYHCRIHAYIVGVHY